MGENTSANHPSENSYQSNLNSIVAGRARTNGYGTTIFQEDEIKIEFMLITKFQDRCFGKYNRQNSCILLRWNVYPFYSNPCPLYQVKSQSVSEVIIV